MLCPGRSALPPPAKAAKGPRRLLESTAQLHSTSPSQHHAVRLQRLCAQQALLLGLTPTIWPYMNKQAPALAHTASMWHCQHQCSRQPFPCGTLQVDALVVGGFTASSTFRGLSVQTLAEQRGILQDAVDTIGINVRTSCLNCVAH